MWSRGSKRRPPIPPRGPGRYWGQRVVRPGQHPAGAQAGQAGQRAANPAWRRLRQRIRAVWRWVIVRTVRGWLGGRSRPVEVQAELAEVRQFPQSRWP